MSDHYDPDGNRISMWEWVELFERRALDLSDRSWWRRRTVTPRGEVSTVWLGLDHSFLWFDGPPLTWETMIFDAAGESHGCKRYTTRAEAWDGHAAAVAELEGAATKP